MSTKDFREALRRAAWRLAYGADYVERIVPLQLPERPELFRLTEQPLGLCPFPLTTVALACMPAPRFLGEGWA